MTDERLNELLGELEAANAKRTRGDWMSKNWRVASMRNGLLHEIVLFNGTNRQSRTPENQANCDFAALCANRMVEIIAALRETADLRAQLAAAKVADEYPHNQHQEYGSDIAAAIRAMEVPHG